MSDCIFCKIAEGEIPSDKVYEDEEMLAFRDLDPQAPVHFLLIPKKHIPSIQAVEDEDEALLGRLMGKIRALADQEGLENGYRVVINCGADGMQTVPHLHIHILGKRKMTWPPG